MLRVGSALVLAPIVVGAAYLGGWLFLTLCLVGATGILWEWTRLTTSRSDARVLAPGSAALLAACVLTGLGGPVAATASIAAGAVLAGIILKTSGSEPQSGCWIWGLGGVIYAGTAFLAPALLRGVGTLGFLAFLFLAASVWMTDICAFLVGRAIGGPALWSRVSPNKTWSGAFGGLAGGVAGGIVVAYGGGLGRLLTLGAIALVLSVSAQAGDLLESAVKRRFGAKDTSHLIPGHGGLMDRLDGFLVAALVALLIGIVHRGTDAPASGLLVW
jgi:phosphatidate cytidylyltransferase